MGRRVRARTLGQNLTKTSPARGRSRAKEYEMKVEEFLREHKDATVDSPQNENPVKGYVEVRCRVVRETEKAYEIEKFYRGYVYRPFNEAMWIPKSVCIVANATPCDVFGNVHEDETYTMITHIKYWFYRNHASFIDNAID